MIMYLWTLVRQWWHCLMGTFGIHRMEYHYRNGEILKVCCECGKVFWEQRK